MRQDKLTTKLQEALGEAQSLALAHDNQFIEPVHLVSALLADTEGSARSLLERSGVNVQQLSRELSAYRRCLVRAGKSKFLAIR